MSSRTSHRKNTPPTASSPQKSSASSDKSGGSSGAERKNTPPTPRGGAGAGGSGSGVASSGASSSGGGPARELSSTMMMRGADGDHHHHGGSASSSSPDRHHSGGHGSKKTPHFVLEAIKLKRVAIISNDMLDSKLIKFDTVGNIITIPPQAKPTTTGQDDDHHTTAKADHQKSASPAVSLAFNEVSAVSDVFGACAETQLEVDRFFETGVPLVGSDSTPDADALIVLSAGPDGATAAKLTFAALDTATKYMAHRSLVVHVSAVAILGKMDDMLNDEDASVTMFDLLEQGAHRNPKPFVLSEPFEPYCDRYTPRHAVRFGLSADDDADKLTRIKIMAEDHLVRSYPKALAFAFFIDCIHFRDGFHRFTSDSHIAVQSAHPSNSLFFSRTTLLCTREPVVAATMVGHTSPLTETALLHPWSAMLRHLGAEAHHVLSIVACVPEPSSVADSNNDNIVEMVEDVESLTFDTSAANLTSPEQLAAREDSVGSIRGAFTVSQMLQKAATSGARAPLPDHVFPKRLHVKLPEYVGSLKRTHDELTCDQKTRQSIAKSALQFLSTQCHSDDFGTVATYGGFGGNQEKFAAIFRAAFVKQKAHQHQQQNPDGSGGGGDNNNAAGRRASAFPGGSSSSPAAAAASSTLAGVLLSPQTPSIMSPLEVGTSSPGGTGSPREVARLRQQNDALTLVKERLEFDLQKLDKETKKLRSELTLTNSRRKRVERELMEARGVALAAETSATKTRTEANAESLELRQKLVNMQLQVDAAERKNEQISEEMRVTRADFERREQLMRQEHEVKFGELEMKLRVALEEKKVLEESLVEHTHRIDDHEERVIGVEVDKKRLTEQLSASAEAIETARVDAKRAIDKASRVRRAEREEYMRLLDAGREATEELVTFEELRVDRVAKNESVYRTGSAGVRSWLSAIQQGQYASNFDGAGFNDVLSVANMQEQDLQHMRILAGHRRRILASAAELKTQLSLAVAKRQMLPLSNDVVSFEKLVGDLREWFRDFTSVVRAEQFNDGELG